LLLKFEPKSRIVAGTQERPGHVVVSTCRRGVPEIFLELGFANAELKRFGESVPTFGK